MWLEVAFDCYFRDMSTLVYVYGAAGLLIAARRTGDCVVSSGSFV